MTAAFTSRSVSAYLTSHGQTAARGLRPGYRTAATHRNDVVTVEYALPPEATDWTQTLRREMVQRYLDGLAKLLHKRYTVTLLPIPNGIGNGWYLRVMDDPEKALTPSQRKALRQIRDGGENYRYGPLTRSVNLPFPVTSKDLTPMFSGGLHAASVMALERRGLVKLVPTTPETGRVVAL